MINLSELQHLIIHDRSLAVFSFIQGINKKINNIDINK